MVLTIRVKFPILGVFKFLISLNHFIWNGITIKEKASVTIKNVKICPPLYRWYGLVGSAAEWIGGSLDNDNWLLLILNDTAFINK